MVDQRAKSIQGIVQWFRDGAACSPDGLRFAPATLLAMAETLDEHDRVKQPERKTKFYNEPGSVLLHRDHIIQEPFNGHQ